MIARLAVCDAGVVYLASLLKNEWFYCGYLKKRLKLKSRTKSGGGYIHAIRSS